MRFDKAKIGNFFKEHWYWVVVGLLSLGILIASIIGGFIKIGSSSSGQTNCKDLDPSTLPMTEISIGASDTPCPQGDCCPDGWDTVPISDNSSYLNQDAGGVPYSQICRTVADTYCDQTSVVTDMNIIDMTDKDGKYKSLPDRCCASADSNCVYYPPLAINVTNPNTEDSGTLPNSVSGCKKMGICVQKQTLGTLRQNKGKYIPFNNVAFVPGSSSASPGDVCSKYVDKTGNSGYVAGGENLYNGCTGGKGLYLCKKYIDA